MFDIGWTELLVLAIVAILIVGPKDLPRMLYALGQTFGKLRRQADEFRRQFNDSMREAGMEDVRNDMRKMSDLNPANQIKDEIESTFRDEPKPASGEVKDKTEEPVAQRSDAPPSEGDIVAQTDDRPAADTASHPEPDNAPEPPGEDPVIQRSAGHKTAANGADTERTATAKDAVN